MSDRKGRRWSLALAALLAFASPSSASVFYKFNVVAETGMANFVSFGTGPSVNDKGKVAFVGRYSNGPSIILWTPIAGNTDIATNFLSPNRSFGDAVRINNNDEVLTWNRVLPQAIYEVRVFRSATPNDSSIMVRGTGAPPYDLLYQNPAMNNTQALEDRSSFIPTGNKDGVCDPGEVCVSQVAFNAFRNTPARFLGTVVKNPTDASDPGVQHEFGLNTSLSHPMMSDDGHIVIRGVNSTDPILLFPYALGSSTTIAGSGQGFTALGVAPGITPDGKIVAFAGNRGHGDGIFLSIDQSNIAAGQRRLVRIVGENATVQKSELGVDGSGNKLYMQSIELDSRVGIIYTPDVDGVANSSVVVSFIGTPNAASRTNPGTGKPFLFSNQKGLWTIRIDLNAPLFSDGTNPGICLVLAPGATGNPFVLKGDDQLVELPNKPIYVGPGANGICETENTDATETLFSRSSPIPVVQIGDTIKSTALHTVSAISVNDPIAQANSDNALNPRSERFGDHRVVFYAQVDAGATQMIVRGEHLDSDQDGLLDHWETEGIDLDGTGNIDLDLPGMGADPFKRDLFVQLDWTADRPPPLNLGRKHRPVAGIIRQLAQFYASAPALPNGIQAGIQLHVDAGTGKDAAQQFFSRNMGVGPLVGGNTVAGGPVDILYFGMPASVSLPGINAVSFDTVKSAVFWNHHRGAREFAFLHIVLADFHHGDPDNNTNPTSGTASGGAAFKLFDNGNVTSPFSIKNTGIKITGGTGAGQLRGVEADQTNSGQRFFVVDKAWNTIPDSTSTYTVLDGSSGEGHSSYRYDGAFFNGKNLAITLGHFSAGPNNEVGSAFEQSQTLKHETGHLLSLMHGGTNHINDKPNYGSLMSYAFQFCLAPRTGPPPNNIPCPILGYAGASDAVSNDWRHIDSRFAHNFRTFGQAFGATDPVVSPFPPPSEEAQLKDLTDAFAPLDTTPPVTALTSPAGGATFSLGSTIPVSFTATDNVAVTRGEVIFDVNGDGVIDEATEIFVPTFTPPGSFNITLPATSGPNGSRTLTVIAYDAAGNPGIVNATINIGSVAPVTVPNVVGLAQAAATDAISAATLGIGAITKQTSGNVPAGSVISQNPAAGQSRPPGTVVDLVISLGTNGVAVPSVVGLSQGAATTAINNAGLTVGSVTQIPSAEPPGVLAQSPDADAIVASGSPVDLLVSQGSNVIVPNVVGLTQAAATTAITGAGLVVGNVTMQSSLSVPAGSVIAQNPIAGASVPNGSAVDLVVSTGLPSLGDTSNLVYKALEPCRIMDTRNATAGSGVQGPIAGGVLKQLPGFITAGSNWVQYGQTGTPSDCGLINPPGSAIHAIAIVITILNPNFDAFLGVSDVGNLSATLSTVALNYTHGQGLSTMYIVPQVASNTIYFALPAGLSAQLIFDVVGYYVLSDATALQCAMQSSAPVTIGAGSTGTATSPACGAGYVLASGGCGSDSFSMKLVSDSASGQAWSCSANNIGGSDAHLTATATCCRVPGK